MDRRFFRGGGGAALVDAQVALVAAVRSRCAGYLLIGASVWGRRHALQNRARVVTAGLATEAVAAFGGRLTASAVRAARFERRERAHVPGLELLPRQVDGGMARVEHAFVVQI